MNLLPAESIAVEPPHTTWTAVSFASLQRWYQAYRGETSGSATGTVYTCHGEGVKEKHLCGY